MCDTARNEMNTLPFRVGQTIKNAAYRVGQTARSVAHRVGSAVGKAARGITRGTDIAQKAVDIAGAVRDKVRGINNASGGLLEEGVRALPFGNSVLKGANVASKAIDRAGAVVRKVRRGAQTVERVRSRAQQAVNNFT